MLNFELLEFGSLTQSQLMEKVRALQNLAYKLGMEEGTKYINIVRTLFNDIINFITAKEMSRGKCLNVFQVENIPTENKTK